MLVVHTGNASCHVLSFWFVPPPLPMTSMSHPPKALAPVLTHGASHPCPSTSMDSLITLLGSPPVARYCSGGFMASLDRVVFWELEARKMLSSKVFICFSKPITVWPLGSQGVQSICFFIGLLQRGKRERKGLGPHPEEPPKYSALMGTTW